MTVLSKSCRQLIVESGIAGVNHNFLKESREIMEALPFLVPDPDVRLPCHALLLHGLGETEKAIDLLKDSRLKENILLRKIFLNALNMKKPDI